MSSSTTFKPLPFNESGSAMDTIRNARKRIGSRMKRLADAASSISDQTAADASKAAFRAVRRGTAETTAAISGLAKGATGIVVGTVGGLIAGVPAGIDNATLKTLRLMGRDGGFTKIGQAMSHRKIKGRLTYDAKYDRDSLFGEKGKTGAIEAHLGEKVELQLTKNSDPVECTVIPYMAKKDGPVTAFQIVHNETGIIYQAEM